MASTDVLLTAAALFVVLVMFLDSLGAVGDMWQSLYRVVQTMIARVFKNDS